MKHKALAPGPAAVEHCYRQLGMDGMPATKRLPYYQKGAAIYSVVLAR
jgi:hypothetical protein